MKRLALALAAAASLSGIAVAPVAAQSLSILLPVISFPDTVVTSTKGCVADQSAAPVCQLQE